MAGTDSQMELNIFKKAFEQGLTPEELETKQQKEDAAEAERKRKDQETQDRLEPAERTGLQELGKAASVEPPARPHGRGNRPVPPAQARGNPT